MGLPLTAKIEVIPPQETENGTSSESDAGPVATGA